MKPPAHGGQWVKLATGVHVSRPNKGAAGHTRTAERSRHTDYGRGANKLLPLIVHGTLDKLASGLGLFSTRRTHCPTCGCKQSGRLGLTDHGRARLARARKREAVRVALVAYRGARDTMHAGREEAARAALVRLGVPAFEWDRDQG